MLFDVDMSHIPQNFLRGHIRVGVGERERRHLKFATQEQLPFEMIELK